MVSKNNTFFSCIIPHSWREHFVHQTLKSNTYFAEHNSRFRAIRDKATKCMYQSFSQPFVTDTFKTLQCGSVTAISRETNHCNSRPREHLCNCRKAKQKLSLRNNCLCFVFCCWCQVAMHYISNGFPVDCFRLVSKFPMCNVNVPFYAHSAHHSMCNAVCDSVNFGLQRIKTPFIFVSVFSDISLNHTSATGFKVAGERKIRISWHHL